MTDETGIQGSILPSICHILLANSHHDWAFSVSERNAAVLGLYIKKVLVQLNLTLVNKVI